MGELLLQLQQTASLSPLLGAPPGFFLPDRGRSGSVRRHAHVVVVGKERRVRHALCDSHEQMRSQTSALVSHLHFLSSVLFCHNTTVRMTSSLCQVCLSMGYAHSPEHQSRSVLI